MASRRMQSTSTSMVQEMMVYFGVRLAAEDLDIAIIDAGYRLLTSKDYIIQDMTWAELGDDVDFRYQNTSFINTISLIQFSTQKKG